MISFMNQKFENIIKSVFNPDLAIAHFPIRSKEQTLSKIVVGWINLPPEIKTAHLKMSNYHWQKMYKWIKKYGKIKNEDVIEFAKKFALENNDIIIDVKEDPVDLSFCRNIEIRYGNNKVRPISNILEQFDIVQQESLEREQMFLSKIEDLSLELNNSLNLEDLEKKRLKNKLEKIENSKSWLLTSPLRKISNYIRKILK